MTEEVKGSREIVTAAVVNKRAATLTASEN